MVGLIDQLAPEYLGDKIPLFVAGARYYANMDYLVYKKEAGAYRADRVDAFLTVLWHPHEDRLIGVKLKGWRYFFNHLKEALNLEDSDFFPLVNALEYALAEEYVLSIMKNHDAILPSERYRRAKRYIAAVRLIDDVSVPTDEWALAA